MGTEDQSDAAPEHSPGVLADDTDVQVEVLGAPDPPPRGGRGQFFKGALVGITVAAVFVVGGFLLGSHRGDGDGAPDRGGAAPAWSSWKPSTSGDAAATEIAVHIGRTYREPNGGQLVRVDGGPLQVAGVPLTVAQRDSADAGGSIRLFRGKTLLYRLCGQGKSCAISDGKPSLERHMLLRREALELALYSLRYMEDLDQVVVFLPPRLGDEPSQALFFRRGQVAGELAKPLEATLVDRVPTIAQMRKSPDAGLVQQLTLAVLYRFKVTQARQDDRAFLLLDPFNSPQAPVQPRTTAPPSLSLS